MDESLTLLVTALLVVIVLAIALGGYLQAKRRRDAL